MVDFLGTIVTAALMVAVVNALVVYLEIGRSAKLALAGTSGLWIGFAAAASASGWLTISDPFPIMEISLRRRLSLRRSRQPGHVSARGCCNCQHR